MSKSQRAAAVEAIIDITGHDVTSTTPVVITSTQLTTVHNTLTELALDGGISFKDTPSNQAKLANPKEMLKYIRGQVKDSLLKSLKLNGGIPYTPKTTRDNPTISNIKLLLVKHAGDEIKVAEIQAVLDLELEKIKNRPIVAKAIVKSVIPEKLQHLIPEEA